MHILLSNDDGVHAQGLRDLAQALPQEWQITIIAPEEQQSGMSHALTVHKDLYLKKHKSEKENINIFSLSGTPTDCVKFALEYYLKDNMPDLVISGVNNGFNLGSDAIYSGTVGAGMEAMFYNIPSIAVSTETYSVERGAEILPFLVDVIEEVFIEKDFEGCININFPLTGVCDWDNVIIAEQDIQRYSNAVEQIEQTDEHEVYRLSGEIDWNTDNPESDIYGMIKGFITITALQWQQLHEEHQDILMQIIDEKNKKPQV